jgi:hypothetical protein
VRIIDFGDTGHPSPGRLNHPGYTHPARRNRR